MDVKARMQKLIEKSRKKLIKERDEYKEKMQESEYLYGIGGGAYRRQEKAMEYRQQQLKELDDFERQLLSTSKHVEVRVYVYRCTECNRIYLATIPSVESIECARCGEKLWQSGHGNIIQVVDNGAAWLEAVKE